MINKWLLGAILTLSAFAVDGHSGRVDKNGGHNCSKKSQKKGLCSGYHYHRAGSLTHNHGGEKHSHLVEKPKKDKATADTPTT